VTPRHLAGRSAIMFVDSDTIAWGSLCTQRHVDFGDEAHLLDTLTRSLSQTDGGQDGCDGYLFAIPSRESVCSQRPSMVCGQRPRR